MSGPTPGLKIPFLSGWGSGAKVLRCGNERFADAGKLEEGRAPGIRRRYAGGVDLNVGDIIHNVRGCVRRYEG